MSKINAEIFHAYDIRGIYPDEIDEETVAAVARAFVKYLRVDLKKKGQLKVALGQDMRTSSPFLAREVLRALTESGIDVMDLGLVPTPALYYAVAFKDLDGGLMITASHNPKQYNGLKLVREKAGPIGRGSGMEQIQSYARAGEEIRAEAKGRVEVVKNITREYVEQDLSYESFAKLKKLRIAADTANAMGAVYLTELFAKIPADLIKVNWDLNGNMPVHEANPLKEETLQQLKVVVSNESADLGIATDGDGDRIGFLDEQGEVIPADIVTGLTAKVLLQKHEGAKIGVDIRSSRVVSEMIKEAGGEPVDIMIGHSLIKDYMPKHDILFAGELSGHYYYRENYNYESPVLVIALLLLQRSLSDKSFSEIWKPYHKYSHSGEINFKVEDKAGMMEKLTDKYKDGKLSRLDGIKIDFADWWFSVRPSNTEPFLRLNLEADTKELMKQKLEEVKGIISGQA